MIGVFDSGHGGLTVQAVFGTRFPDQDFTYLGDHLHAPYGAQSTKAVLAHTRAGIERLFDEGCRLVIVACNTAAAIALRSLQQDWLPHHFPERRILGVIVPVVEAITHVPWAIREVSLDRPGEPLTVGIFGTVNTVESMTFPVEIAKRAPAVKVVQQACPELAGAIEAGAGDAELAALVERYVAALLLSLEGEALDVVVLGCTHFPLVSTLFGRFLPAGVKVLSQPDLVAASLHEYLRRHPEFRISGADPNIRRQCRFLTTGDPVYVTGIAGRFLGRGVIFTAPRY